MIAYILVGWLATIELTKYSRVLNHSVAFPQNWCLLPKFVSVTGSEVMTPVLVSLCKLAWNEIHSCFLGLCVCVSILGNGCPIDCNKWSIVLDPLPPFIPQHWWSLVSDWTEGVEIFSVPAALTIVPAVRFVSLNVKHCRFYSNDWAHGTSGFVSWCIMPPRH